MTDVRRAAKRIGRPPANVDFNEPSFERTAKDLRDSPVPVNRVTISDPQTPNLRVTVSRAGTIAYHVNYTVGDVRGYLTIGYYPMISVADARYLASVIQKLAAKGIDVQAGLHDRLMRELMEHGTAWRPDMMVPKASD